MTPRRLETLKFIRQRIAAGRAPTIMKIAEHFRIARLSAYARLPGLRADGMLLWHRCRRRSFLVTPEGQRRADHRVAE